MQSLREADPDLPLVERIGQGDAAAVRLLVNAKISRLHALASRMLGDAGEAEDVVQETFVKAWKQAARWRPGQARFDTWLHTVTLNLCRDRLRRRRDVPTDNVPDHADPSPNAESQLTDKEQSRSVAAAIGALPERQRDAIILVHYQDMTNSEAALALDVSVDALESLLARGRRALRKALVDGEGLND